MRAELFWELSVVDFVGVCKWIKGRTWCRIWYYLSMFCVHSQELAVFDVSPFHRSDSPLFVIVAFLLSTSPLLFIGRLPIGYASRGGAPALVFFSLGTGFGVRDVHPRQCVVLRCKQWERAVVIQKSGASANQGCLRSGSVIGKFLSALVLGSVGLQHWSGSHLLRTCTCPVCSCSTSYGPQHFAILV